MNRHKLFVIILLLTIIIIIFILLLNNTFKYNKLVISKGKWNSIISNKKITSNIYFESIEFNDYKLIIDENNSIIYYSIVESSNKYNPSIKYKTNKKVNIAINNIITDDKIEQEDVLKIILYNNNEYRIYKLVPTNYSILNITNKEDNNKQNMEAYLFDNHIDSSRRILKSNCRLKIIKEDNEYSFSLKKESLGHNKRENYISIFGMDKRDEYLIKLVNNKLVNNKLDREKYIRFFINNEYKGVYSLIPRKGRINNFERNKENNK